MIDSIFEKYRIPESYSKNPLGTLFFILRKAELAKNLSYKEWACLESLNLSDTISLIKSQEENRRVIEEYRTSIANSVRADLISLRHNKFVRQKILTIPTVESERALVFFKVHNQEELGTDELEQIDRSYTHFLSFIKLKEKLGITEDIAFDQDSVQRLTKLTLGEALKANDYLWLRQNNVYSAVSFIESHASRLFNKYQCIVTELVADEFLNLCLILQKIEEGSPPNEAEQQFLSKNHYELALAAAQKLEFIALKHQFSATQFESDDPSQHLFKVLRKLRDEKPLTEPDVNFLKKRKLTETLKFLYKRKAEILTNKVKQGHGLADDDIAWCKEYSFEEIICLSLKIDYDVKHRNDGIDSPLYAILSKLNANVRLSEQDHIWIEVENLFYPDKKIFISHHRIEASHYEEEFKRTKGYWNIVNASAHWRKANQPESALKQTNNLQQLRSLKEAKLRSALFTTRGGALRDLERLGDAEKCALEAISHFANSHNPYTLMGALCYDTGRYGEGYEWFEKAIQRGANPNDQDSEIKRILKKKKGKERQQIIDHLFEKDPRRFFWVKKFTEV